MKKAIAEKWISALRSNKYKQGKDYLCQAYTRKGKKPQFTHCCLGVLCDMYNKEHAGKDKLKVNELTGTEYDVVMFNDKAETLPRKVMKWAGIKSDIGEIKNDWTKKNYDSLAEMNDCGESFKTISNVVEKNYKNI